jgi:hypothetical protein
MAANIIFFSYLPLVVVFDWLVGAKDIIGLLLAHWWPTVGPLMTNISVLRATKDPKPWFLAMGPTKSHSRAKSLAAHLLSVVPKDY